jgi:hypothetical protein
MLLAFTGCATIAAPEETKALNDATTPFVASLRSLEGDRAAALAASNRARAFQNALAGGPLAYRTDCEAQAVSAEQAFLASLGRSSYHATATDTAYALFRNVTPCEYVGVAVEAAEPAKPIAGPTGDPDANIPMGNTSLKAVGSELAGYVKALSDLATGETYGKLAEQRKKAFEAAGSFAGALGIPFASQAAAILRAAADSAEASRRNAATLRILNEIDAILPAYMERVGSAGRVALASTIVERARAATTLANTANSALALPEVVASGTLRTQLLVNYDEQLRAENGALLSLRTADPMRAARAFAGAHRALRDVFADPRSQRSALARGLKDFQEAATALDEALAEAKQEGG